MITRRKMSRDVLGVGTYFLVVLFLLAAVMKLSACTSIESGDAESAFASSGNEYTLSVIDLPEPVYWILSLEKTQGDKIRMVGIHENSNQESFSIKPTLWELSDDDSWKELVDFSQLLPLNENENIAEAHITQDNRVLCAAETYQDKVTETRFFLVDSDLKNYRELKLDSSEYTGESVEETLRFGVSRIYPLADDQFLIQNGYNALFVLDLATETIEPRRLKEGSATWWIMAAAELNGTVYVCLQDRFDNTSSRLSVFDNKSAKISILDMSTGAYHDLDTENHVQFNELFRDLSSSRDMVRTTFKTDYDSNRITVCLGTGGVFEFSNNEFNKIADAEGTILSNPSTIVEDCVFDNRDDFYLLNFNIGDADAPPYSLYKYEKTN